LGTGLLVGRKPTVVLPEQYLLRAGGVLCYRKEGLSKPRKPVAGCGAPWGFTRVKQWKDGKYPGIQRKEKEVRSGTGYCRWPEVNWAKSSCYHRKNVSAAGPV